MLAAVALALGLVTLGMNQTASQAAPPKILPLKLRHHTAVHMAKESKATSKAAPKAKTKAKVKVKKPDPRFVAALQAGLPRSVAHALAAKPSVVVALTSASDSVAELSAVEAKAGAGLAGASYVAVNVDHNGGDVEVLTRLLGQLPVTPTALIYKRPATLVATLPGFNDRTVVQQAVANALRDPAGT